MVETSKSSSRFTILQGVILLVGLLVFVLLLFADKTNLDNDSEAAMGGRAGDGGKSSEAVQQPGLMTDLLAKLPKDETADDIAQLRTALEAEKNPSQREELYKQIVGAYSQAERLDLAAVYAAAFAAEVPSSRNFVVAGALFRNAAKMPAPSEDTLLFRRLSNEAIRHDESALELEPKNEDAMLEQGLALVESRIPGNSMQGIFKIRALTEMNPSNVEALFHLGQFSMDTGQFDKAANRFRQILDVTPADARAKYFLAIAEQKLGNSAEFKRLMTEVAVQMEDANFSQMAKAALSETP